DAIRLVVQGIEERGVLGECDGVLSGYLGSPDTGEAVADAVAKVKSANPAARYCCDPVIGDVDSGVFVRPGIPEFFKQRLLPIAASGAGDAITALFFAHYLSTGSAAEAMALAGSSIFGVLSRTAEAGASELLLVEAQEEFVAPVRVFTAHEI